MEPVESWSARPPPVTATARALRRGQNASLPRVHVSTALVAVQDHSRGILCLACQSCCPRSSSSQPGTGHELRRGGLYEQLRRQCKHQPFEVSSAQSAAAVVRRVDVGLSRRGMQEKLRCTAIFLQGRLAQNFSHRPLYTKYSCWGSHGLRHIAPKQIKSGRCFAQSHAPSLAPRPMSHGSCCHHRVS